MSPVLLRRTEIKLKAGAQCGSAPRDPPGNGQGGRAKQQRCCAQRRKFPCSGKSRSSAARAARFRLWLPLGGEAKVDVRGRTFNNLNSDLSALCGLYRSFPRSRKKEKNNHPTHHLQSTHIPTNEMYLFFKHHKIRGEIVDFFSKKYYDSLCWQQ